MNIMFYVDILSAAKAETCIMKALELCILENWYFKLFKIVWILTLFAIRNVTFHFQVFSNVHHYILIIFAVYRLLKSMSYYADAQMDAGRC